MIRDEKNARSGLTYALGAYGIWGILPLYLMLLPYVPPLEFVGWRVLLTLPVCLAIVVLRRQAGQVLAAMGEPRTIALLCTSSLFIAVNWLVYVTAVQSGHVYAASLGYYINPLVNVLAGTLFLGERLSRLQWAAVTIAATGVTLLAWGAGETLGISLSLAISFSTYGLVRKLAPVGSVPGLTIESAILTLPALGVIAWHAAGPAGQSFGHDPMGDAVLAGAGVMTATPLLLFAMAARRMTYSALGFVQYLAPTMVFLIGLFVFDEQLRPVQLASFALIWAAIAVFSWDAMKSARRG